MNARTSRDIHDRSVKLVGRVDRIDKHVQTGQYRVLDYKTSETASTPKATHRSKDEWIDLQLPLYRLLVRSEGITSNVELGYIQLPGDLSKNRTEAIADWTDAELLDAENLARSIAADIIDLKINDVVSPGGRGSGGPPGREETEVGGGRGGRRLGGRENRG